MQIEVATLVTAPLQQVWTCYTGAEHIVHWNAASDDWHTPRASADLRPGGGFCYRMEARDGSVGFDFEGVFTAVIPQRLIEYSFGERTARVEFVDSGSGVQVRVSFDAEDSHTIEQQRQGWQAILDRFAAYVEGQG